MFIQEISIDIKSKIDKDALLDDFHLIMSHYRSSGQISSYEKSTFIKSNKIICYPYTIDEKALDKKHDNFYVSRQRKKIEKFYNSKLKIKTVGKSFDTYKGGCQCKKSAFYILFTTYIISDSPITCGTCNKCVPLYKLPKYNDFGYLPILSWETNYISCDSLQMNCEVGEKWTLNQMQEVKSQLSKQGLKICKKIQELTDVPTYYYLHNYRSISSVIDKKRLCPICGNKWLLKNSLHKFIDLKCDKCKLVSALTPNSD